MTKISIIIPVYNAQDYLVKCLDSVLGQDMDDMEVICIDDGSSDASLQILKSYAEKDNRFVCITQNNQGVSVARNKGITMAKGDYILFIDADDYLKENCIKYLCSCADNNKLDLLVFGYYHVVNDFVSETAFIDIWKNKFSENCFNFKFEDSFLLNGSVWNKLISKNVIKESKAVFPVNISYAEDTIFCYRLYPYIRRFQVISVPYYFYQNRASASLSNKRDIFITLDKLFPEFLKNVPRTHIVQAMNYWCNFYTWNLLKRKTSITVVDYNIMLNFLNKFEVYDAELLSTLEHYQRLKQEISVIDVKNINY